MDFSSSTSVCDSKFLSITLGLNRVKHRWKGFYFGSKKLQALAKGLSPCYLRLGGTYADFLTFDPYGDESATQLEEKNSSMEMKNDALVELEHSDLWNVKKNFKNFTMTGTLWDQMTKFFSLSGWDVMFDFNLFKRIDGKWDPTNAIQLLKYSARRGYGLHAFQLGNEPNSFMHNFNFSIMASTLVEDFRSLRNILMSYPQYMNNGLYGPDVTNLDRHSSSRKYLQEFVKAGGNKVVREISLHHYYMNGRTAQIWDFYKTSTLDSLKLEFELGHQLSGGAPIRLTETSSCYGGGAPGLSDRYVAGFLWLDKLGLAAKYGVTKVFRQTFFGGNYALLSEDLDPNPDYFLSLLHKNLIEGPVFNTSIDPSRKYLRIYAHCTRSGLYKRGAVTLAVLNTRNSSTSFSVGQFPNSSFDLYILTPGDSNGLKSKYVKLNGQVLKMSGSSLPALKPKLSKESRITFPGLSFGFVVITDAKVPLCMKYNP